MPRGITQEDVWKACDALLLEGARPTIERVRQKIGRGSPNTVSPFLETWFRYLGARIQDPGAFSAPPDIPDPVLQAAKHFWEAALALTRSDFDERLREGLAAAVVNVEAEKEKAAQASAAAFDASARCSKLQAELAERHTAFEQERATRVTAEAQLAQARGLLEELRTRVQQAEASALAAREDARRDVQTAQERAAAVERRALLDADAERTARGKSDKRAEALEGRLQGLTAEAQASQAKLVEQLATARAEHAAAATALDAAELQARTQREQLAAMMRELEASRSQAQAAASQSDLAERVIAAFKAGTPKATARARATKRTARA